MRVHQPLILKGLMHFQFTVDILLVAKLFTPKILSYCPSFVRCCGVAFFLFHELRFIWFPENLSISYHIWSTTMIALGLKYFFYCALLFLIVKLQICPGDPRNCWTGRNAHTETCGMCIYVYVSATRIWTFSRSTLLKSFLRLLAWVSGPFLRTYGKILRTTERTRESTTEIFNMQGILLTWYCLLNFSWPTWIECIPGLGLFARRRFLFLDA